MLPYNTTKSIIDYFRPRKESIKYNFKEFNLAITKCLTLNALRYYPILKFILSPVITPISKYIDSLKELYYSRKTISDVTMLKVKQLIKKEEFENAIKLLKYSNRYSQYLSHTYRYFWSYDEKKLDQHIKKEERFENKIKEMIIMFK